MFYHTPPSFNAVPDNNDYFVAGTAFQRSLSPQKTAKPSKPG
tara:strand:- start:208 stop:333 length:126 start_codon:yes stop_codon:yes gene_type:complete